MQTNDSFSGVHLNEDRCFLCSTALTPELRTDEHVIPVWLQHQHQLWDQSLELLNGTRIPYRNLKIPCCRVCNGGPLSKLEDDVKQLLSGPFRHPSEGDEYRLFQWCSKLLYGLLFREMSLPRDRRTPGKGPIVPKDFLSGLATFHHFMTSIRRPFRFDGFKPYSLFVAEAAVGPNVRNNFDYIDWIVSVPSARFRANRSLAVHVKHFAIFCVFQDNGLQKPVFQKQFDRFAGIPLHPLQFLELACKTAYKHSLLSFEPLYRSVFLDSPNSEVVVTNASIPPSHPWDSWVNEAYAKLFCELARARGHQDVPNAEDFYVGELHHTFLFDSDGAPRRMSLGSPED